MYGAFSLDIGASPLDIGASYVWCITLVTTILGDPTTCGLDSTAGGTALPSPWSLAALQPC